MPTGYCFFLNNKNRGIGNLYQHLKRSIVIEFSLFEVLRLLWLRIRLIHEIDEAHYMLIFLVVDIEMLSKHVHFFLFALFSFDMHEDVELIG